MNGRGYLTEVDADLEALQPLPEFQALFPVPSDVDPDEEQIAAAKDHGADRIELYTGPFADTVWSLGPEAAESQASLTRYQTAARYAKQLALGVNAGHDLDLINLPIFCQILEIDEMSIGHALISDALEIGLFETTRKYLTLIEP